MAATIAITIDKLGAHRPVASAPPNGFELVYSVTVNGVQKIGRQGLVFQDLQNVREWLRQGTDDETWQEIGELLLRFIIRRWRAVDPTFSNPALIRGRTVTFDVDALGTVS